MPRLIVEADDEGGFDMDDAPGLSAQDVVEATVAQPSYALLADADGDAQGLEVVVQLSAAAMPEQVEILSSSLSYTSGGTRREVALPRKVLAKKATAWLKGDRLTVRVPLEED